MHSNLAFYETRVIGALLEKEITTPDQYPLSLNALTNACNQKSNRDPVLNLDEATVQQTLDGLIKKHLVSEKTGFGSRVTKYQHRFCNTAFGALRLSAQELAIIAELLLRGPQTPGELRTRAGRLGKFNDAQEVEAALRNLIEREDGPFVVQLAREAGRRESRYAHLLSGAVQAAESAAGPPMEVSITRSNHDRLSELEQQIAALRQEISEIRILLEQRE
ncbi:MAG: YceH family protein [Gammaproteobacteria bacterium]